MKSYKLFTYFFAVCVPGLEPVLIDEINKSEIKLAGPPSTERGKVLFRAEEGGDGLFSLRCADNIYTIIAELDCGSNKNSLDSLSGELSKIKWREILPYASDKIIISASRSGKASFSRFDAEKKAAAALAASDFAADTTESAADTEDKSGAVNIRLDCMPPLCRVSLKLTGADFRFRGKERAFRQGSIRPTVASALVRLSCPRGGEVFYDPFCGSGTIIGARSEFSAKRLLASDIDPECVETARQNCGPAAIIFRRDARETQAADRSIDTIVTNPPWNRQVGVGDAVLFYSEFLTEAARILKNDGKIIMLTDCLAETEAGAAAAGFEAKLLYMLSLHGLRPGVFLLTKRTSD